MTQIHTPILVFPPKFENTTHEVVSLVVQDLCKNVLQTVCFDNRQRSGSVPSQKKSKQSDIQSVSTMTGTFPSHKSDKRIQDMINTKRIQIKVPQQKKEQKTNQMNKETTWYFDKKGYMVSPGLDISTIKYYFIKVATKFGMIVMRDLQDIITVKTQKIDSVRCLFMMCLPLMSDRSVYQLQRYKINKGCKVRLSLISGAQNKYDEFKKSFFYQLWDKNVLSLTNYEALNLLCFANRSIIEDAISIYKQACNQFEIKSLGNEQQIQTWQNSLMKKYKHSQQKLTQVILDNKNNKIKNNKINQVIIQRIIINQIPICQFYLKMEMIGNQQLHQKKKIILQTYSIKKMFQFLEIDSRLLNPKYISSQKLVAYIRHEDLPYSQAIEYLNDLNIILSPLENIAKIGKFGDKLLECFQNQSGKCQNFMDMDSQLPLSIYCCLVSKNSQLKPIISLMHDYFQPQDEYQSQNRILAALKAGLQYIRQEWIVKDFK